MANQTRLPNFAKAKIEPDKFHSYSMNPENIGNQRKWVAFEEIGYKIRDDEGRRNAARDVIDQLRNWLPHASATPGKMTQYGQRYQVRVGITGPNGKVGTLVTIWQIETEQGIPRLITNWLEVHR